MENLIEVCVGKRFKVSMTPQVAKKFRKVSAQDRARCQMWMVRYADDGHDYLDDKKLRHEGTFSAGIVAGTKVAILAFKSGSVRVYGGVIDGNHFIATEIDPDKKQAGANQTMLKDAAKKLGKYMSGGEAK